MWSFVCAVWILKNIIWRYLSRYKYHDCQPQWGTTAASRRWRGENPHCLGCGGVSRRNWVSFRQCPQSEESPHTESHPRPPLHPDKKCQKKWPCTPKKSQWKERGDTTGYKRSHFFTVTYSLHFIHVLNMVLYAQLYDGFHPLLL